MIKVFIEFFKRQFHKTKKNLIRVPKTPQLSKLQFNRKIYIPFPLDITSNCPHQHDIQGEKTP